jgi:hypothetical protein
MLQDDARGERWRHGIETICEAVEYDGRSRYAWKSVSDGPARYGGGFTATATDDGTLLRYEGWATTTGSLAQREDPWGHQAQREVEAELAAIKNALEATDESTPDGEL